MRGDVAVGALVGYVSSRAMDGATAWFRARQSESSRRREEELAPGGTLVQVGKGLGGALGRELDERGAARVGLAAHRTLGALYGMAAAALVGRGVRPLPAGLGVAAAAWVVVDEGTAISTFSDYPVESHLRGVVGHATFGLVAGTLLRIVDRG